MERAGGRSEEEEASMVEVEEGRAVGSRWDEVQRQSLRSHRVEVVALWCRRVAGLLVWGFVGIIIIQLWQVAWQLRDVKLMALCLLITASLGYIFYKRYQHIRGIGLRGMELVRALAVNESDYAGLRGVNRKARAMCVDFKYDPQAAFREKAEGQGFEPYPPPSRMPLSLPLNSNDEARPSTSWRKGQRRRLPWLWARGRRNRDSSPRQRIGIINTSEAGDEPSSRGVRPRPRSPANVTQHRAVEASGLADDDARRGGSDAQVDGDIAPRLSDGTSAAGPATGRGSTVDRASRGGGQVIRACELNPACSICLFEYYVGEDATLLPCGHLYHTECIDIWMREHVDCPYCRADINMYGTGAGGSISASNPEYPSVSGSPGRVTDPAGDLNRAPHALPASGVSSGGGAAGPGDEGGWTMVGVSDHGAQDGARSEVESGTRGGGGDGYDSGVYDRGGDGVDVEVGGVPQPGTEHASS